MRQARKAALGFAGGAAAGMAVALLLTWGVMKTTEIREGGGMIGLINLAGIGLGGFVAGTVGGLSLGRGWKTALAYGAGFILPFYAYALSALVFL